MWCESSVRGTLISEIHPGGLSPASSVSVQTLNFLTRTTRITAQPFAVCLLSLHLPPFSALALFISPHITTIFITQKHSTLCEFLHLRHKVIITQKCLFPDVKMNDAAHTHTLITYNHCVHISSSVWNNKQVEIWLWVRRTNAVLMSFWKMKSVRAMTNEVTGVQHSNKTPWAVKLCFQTTAPSKWDRWENCLWMRRCNSCKTPVWICVRASVCWI